MEYVYKYLNHRGDTVYVGITNDMQRRVREHRSDKLSEIKNPLIFYFPVKYRGDAEMLETYLINWYGTGRYYNVSKTRKGDFSFLDVCNDFPWVQYGTCSTQNVKPFVISDVIGTKEVVVEKERVIEKKVYVESEEDKHELVLLRLHEAKNALDNLSEETDKQIEKLLRLRSKDNDNIDREAVEEGLAIYKKRKKILELQKKLYKYFFIPEGLGGIDKEQHIIGKKKFERTITFAKNCSEELNRHMIKVG